MTRSWVPWGRRFLKPRHDTSSVSESCRIFLHHMVFSERKAFVQQRCKMDLHLLHVFSLRRAVERGLPVCRWCVLGTAPQSPEERPGFDPPA